jgi:hypothetical protein
MPISSELISNLTALPAIQGVAMVAGGAIMLATLLGAIKKIYDFGKAARTKPEESVDPGPAKEFDALRLGILNNTLAHNYPMLLNRLRQFFLQHNLIEDSSFEAFFDTWLSHPIVQFGEPVLVPGMYDDANVSRMKTAHGALRT